MPLAIDQLPPTIRTLPERLARVERALLERAAARRLEHSALAGTPLSAAKGGGVLFGGDVQVSGTLDVTGAITAAGQQLGSSVLDWINAHSMGAQGDGITDDYWPIQAALDSCPPGGRVILEGKRYLISRPLTVAPYVTLMGPGSNRDGTSDTVACIMPGPGFTGTAAIRMVDADTGGYTTAHHGARVERVQVDGRLLTTETVGAIEATGYVHGTSVVDVVIRAMTSHSIMHIANGSGVPYSWYFDNVQIFGSGSATTWDGFHTIATDHVMIGCRTEGVRGNGYFLSGGPNSVLLGCRAEWSAGHGFYVTGGWGVAQGSGGLLLSGCSTDRNSQHGVYVDATGNCPVLISGHMARRDGRNGFPGSGGGGLAALRVFGATTPVIVTGLSCYPGVGDDGLGVSSPERGISVANSTYVSVDGGYIHADVLPVHDGGGNAAFYRGMAIGTATGPTNAPIRSAAQPATLPGPLTLTQGGYTATRGAPTNLLLSGQIPTDTSPRVRIDAAGTVTWGPGTAPADTTLARLAAAVLQLLGTLNITNGSDVNALDLVNALAGGNTAPHIKLTAATAVSDVLGALVAGDTIRRFDLLASGGMSWGSGAAARDVSLGRTAAGQLSLTTADLRIATAGRGLAVAEGTNARAGTAVLAGGTVTVTTTAVTATSRIQLTTQAPGGTVGAPYIAARTPGTGFTITSTSPSDSSAVAWLIVEPA